MCTVYTVYTTNRRSLQQPQLAAGSVSGWISFGELQCERNLHRQVGIMFADLRRTWQFPHIVPLAVNTELGTRQCDAWFQATKILIMELWPYSSWHRGLNITFFLVFVVSEARTLSRCRCCEAKRCRVPSSAKDEGLEQNQNWLQDENQLRTLDHFPISEALTHQPGMIADLKCWFFLSACWKNYSFYES